MDKKQIEKEIQSVVKQLVEKYKPEKVILFGSAAKGEFSLDSDLDFLIIKEQVPANGIERRWEVRKIIKKRVPADFLVYRQEEMDTSLQLGDPFITTILEEGRILYGG